MNFLTFLKKVILAVPLACYTFYYFSLSLVEVYHLLVLFINQVLLNNFNFGCFYALSLFGILYHQPVIVSLFAIVQLLYSIILIIWYLLFRVKNGQIEHDNSGGGDNDFQQILVSVVLSLVAVLFVKDLKERQPQTRRLNWEKTVKRWENDSIKKFLQLQKYKILYFTNLNSIYLVFLSFKNYTKPNLNEIVKTKKLNAKVKNID